MMRASAGLLGGCFGVALVVAGCGGTTQAQVSAQTDGGSHKDGSTTGTGKDSGGGGMTGHDSGGSPADAPRGGVDSPVGRKDAMNAPGCPTTQPAMAAACTTPMEACTYGTT